MKCLKLILAIKFLDNLLHVLKMRKNLIQFRTSNHRFAVETDRWYNIPLNERRCILCDKVLICDEIHYIL